MTLNLDDILMAVWYPVVDDCIGGYAVSNVDKPVSGHDHDAGEGAIADFVDERVAKHIAELHNAWLDGQTKSRRDALAEMVAQAEELDLPY